MAALIVPHPRGSGVAGPLEKPKPNQRLHNSLHSAREIIEQEDDERLSHLINSISNTVDILCTETALKLRSPTQDDIADARDSIGADSGLDCVISSVTDLAAELIKQTNDVINNATDNDTCNMEQDYSKEARIHQLTIDTSQLPVPPSFDNDEDDLDGCNMLEAAKKASHIIKNSPKAVHQHKAQKECKPEKHHPRFLTKFHNLCRTTLGKHDRSIVHYASKKNYERVEALLSLGTDVNYVEAASKETALMQAASRGSASIVELLLKHGAEVARANKHHDTALILAAKNGHLDIVRMLVQAGANAAATGKHGLSAANRAVRERHYDVAVYLSTQDQLTFSCSAASATASDLDS